MTPADQRLRPQHPAAERFHLRLVMQLQFAALQRQAQAIFQQQTLEGLVFISAAKN